MYYLNAKSEGKLCQKIDLSSGKLHEKFHILYICGIGVCFVLPFDTRVSMLCSTFVRN